MNNLTIRSATAADTAALATLAALDSRTVPAAPQLVATDGDQLTAAVSTHDGAAIADPFVRSADVVEILPRRAAARRRRRRPADRRRLVPRWCRDRRPVRPLGRRRRDPAPPRPAGHRNAAEQPPRLRPARDHPLRPCREHRRESAGVARLDP